MARSFANRSAARSTSVPWHDCARSAPCIRAPARGASSKRRRSAREASVADARTPRAQRVRVDATDIAFVDRLQGPQRQDLGRDVGDFVVRRADGLFAYQLAVVVDDALQGVTTIVRGADLLASTPRQVFLQQLLGLPTPEYLHVPVAINRAGEKLSKQTRAHPLPDDPVPPLLAAWHFLDQRTPDVRPNSASEFLAWAVHTWSRARLPPVAMLPAPRDF